MVGKVVKQLLNTRRNGSTKGMTIGTVLLLVTVGSLAIFTMVAMAFFHLRFSNAVVNQRSARNMAESALSTALVKVWNDNEFGTARDKDEFLHLASSTDEAAEAFLSFNEEKAASLGVPFSTNNFQGGAAVEGGNGRSVPDNAVHLVAVGVCRGSQYKAEVLYYVPPYPNAMASSGPVVSTGGLLVAGVSSVEQATELAAPTGFDSNKLEPGHIVSNSPNPQAIFVGPNSQVRGDVVAVGGITVNPNAEVLGEVRPNASRQKVPDFNVDEIFNKLSGLKSKDTLTASTLPGNTVLDYFTEARNSLTIQGDLLLDSGVLYCRENLLVRGQVKGNGAIICLGDVKIESGADLTANDQVALVAKGTLELEGTNKNSQFFSGLVYSEKEILASNITIIGSAVVNGDAQSTLHLNNVSLVKSPISVTTVLGVPLEPPKFDTSLPQNTKDSDFFESEKKNYSFEPPGIDNTLKATLTGGIQMSGMRLEKKKGEEQRYSILFEAVFRRGIGEISSEADLTADELATLQLDSRKYYFAGGNLYLRYDRLSNATSEEVLGRYEELKTELKTLLPPPVPFKIKEQVKKRVLVFRSSKTNYRDMTLDPSNGLNLDVRNYLARLVGPNKEETPAIIDLNLNRVIDSAEKSRIMLWQQF